MKIKVFFINHWKCQFVDWIIFYGIWDQKVHYYVEIGTYLRDGPATQNIYWPTRYIDKIPKAQIIE